MSKPNETPTKPAVPANIMAERVVLGSLLLNPDALALIDGRIQPADFYRESHGVIFEAMQEIGKSGTPIDLVTLIDALERKGVLLQVGGVAYLTGLAPDVPTALHIEHYTDIVADLATLRRLLLTAGEMAKLAYTDEPNIDDILDTAETMVMAIGKDALQRSFVPVRNRLPSIIERLDYLSRHTGELTGVPSGLTMLDRMLGGFQKNDLIILAGRPSMGKTACALTFAHNAAKRHGANVGIVSLEMSSDQLIQRLIASESNIDGNRLRNGAIHEQEWPVVMDAANTISGLNIYIDDTPASKVTSIRAHCRRLHREHPIDLLIIDYLQLIPGNKAENRHLELSQTTKALKALARELNIPIIVLSQLSRSLESRVDKRPMLSDLRESGAIEEDADVVIFIYRDDYYHEDSDKQNIADLLIAKHRNGATGTVSLFFRRELMQFRDLELRHTELDY